jgi:flagellar hook assembly protein FlgD
MAGINPLGLYGYSSASTSQTTTDQKASDSNPLGAGTVDKTEFLKLLVVQLQNQDPLSPIKNEDFLAQMATFSSLEQLISINQAVTKIAGTDQTNAAGTAGQQKSA